MAFYVTIISLKSKRLVKNKKFENQEIGLLCTPKTIFVIKSWHLLCNNISFINFNIHQRLLALIGYHSIEKDIMKHTENIFPLIHYNVSVDINRIINVLI